MNQKIKSQNLQNDKTLKSSDRRKKMEVLNDEYEKLRSNKKAWKEELKERKALEGTIADGLD